MSIFISLFFITTIIALFAAHWFLYFSLIRFFGLQSSTNKWTIAAVLFFLAVSFIVALLLTHWKENEFTRALYYLSGFWLGFLANLVLSLAIAWIIFLIVRYFGIEINSGILGAVFILLAVAYSVWGVWNASNPVIKQINVSIPNLPAAWKGQKIVQLSDVHLGLTNRKDFMEKVVQKVNAENPAAVMITGDLFDGMDGDLGTLATPINDIKAPKGIYFVTGNHETYLGLKEVFAALEKTAVKVLNDEMMDADGLKIIGTSYPEMEGNKNIPEVLSGLKAKYFGQPNVLLYHSPSDINQIKNMGINLELCGHTHKGQIFPFHLITKMIFHGYDYGLHTLGNYTLYTTSGTGSWGPPMRTEGRGEIVVITLQ